MRITASNRLEFPKGEDSEETRSARRIFHANRASLARVRPETDHGRIPARTPKRPAGDVVPMRMVVAGFFVALVVWMPDVRAAAPENVSSAPHRTPTEEQKAFHLPPGFVAELVAAEPEIHKPLNIAFDDRGRLWLTETVEYPFPAAQGTTPRDGVKILSDFGPDGHARKIETFATGLNIPIGVLPLPGGNSALVHSIPNVFLLTDTDGDGKADKREPAYQTFGAKDTHGMTNSFTWGFDGWVYATHGFSNESKVEGADQKPIVMQSGNTYRMRQDGSHIEYVTHGQVNPFGLVFDPLGNLYSSDCHSRPIYQLLRGAWYPSFGKPDDGLGFGPEMCFHDHGSTGIAGIVYYAADQFPKAYHNRMFIGNPVTNRINQDTIEWRGSTPKAIEQPDFLISDDSWFRPVDLKLGPDGALYVADFYNRIIGHYEVPLTHPGRDRTSGRIWRIVYRGIDGKGKLDAANAFEGRTNSENLGSPNLTVRALTTNRLATHDVNRNATTTELTKLASGPDVHQRVHALWLLQRWGAFENEALESGDILINALSDDDRTIRVHALKILGEFAKLNPVDTVLARKALRDPDPFVQRAAAETLGRHPNEGNVLPLLDLRSSIPTEDTHLLHVVRMALRDQLLKDEAWSKLQTADLTARRRADLADVAPGVASAASAGFLFEHLKTTRSFRHEDLKRYLHHVARRGKPGIEAPLLAYLQLLTISREQSREVGGLLGQVELLKAYQQGLQERGVPLNDDGRKFAEALAGELLGSSKENETLAGINLAGAFRLAGVRDRLIALSRKDAATEGQRLEALSAVGSIDPKGATPALIAMLADSSGPVSLRDRAATLLAASNQPEARKALLDALPTAPERVQSAIAAGLAARRPGALGLLDLIASGKASARLLQENRVAGPLGNAGVPDLKDRLAALLKGLPPADEKINALIAVRKAGYGLAKADVEAGAKVFETSCAACHQLGGKGGKVGPQLDGLGLRGLDRVLEDVLDPGRNVDQTFRATNLALKDGRVVSGLLLREEGEVIVMADAQGKEVRVPLNTVEERSILPLSPMPANFDEQIKESDFYRLIAYLLARKPKE